MQRYYVTEPKKMIRPKDAETVKKELEKLMNNIGYIPILPFGWKLKKIED